MTYRPVRIIPAEVAVHECYTEPPEPRTILVKLGLGLGRTEQHAYMTQAGAEKLRDLLVELLGPPGN